MNEHKPLSSFHGPIPEDWLAIFIAFILVLLAALGILGPHGIPVTF